jgi:hypothetical protein
MARYLILSMHRSGSSLLTKILKHALGRDDAVEDADAYNVSGYNEDEHLVSYNEKIFSDQGKSWFECLADLTDSEKKAIKYHYESYLNALSDNTVIKDPRVLNVFGKLEKVDFDGTILLLRRSTESVRESIKRRNGFSDKVIEDYISSSKNDEEYIISKYSPIIITYEDICDQSSVKRFLKDKLGIKLEKHFTMLGVSKRRIYLRQIKQSLMQDLQGVSAKNVSTASIYRRFIKYKALIGSLLK